MESNFNLAYCKRSLADKYKNYTVNTYGNILIEKPTERAVDTTAGEQNWAADSWNLEALRLL